MVTIQNTQYSFNHPLTSSKYNYEIFKEPLSVNPSCKLNAISNFMDTVNGELIYLVSEYLQDYKSYS